MKLRCLLRHRDVAKSIYGTHARCLCLHCGTEWLEVYLAPDRWHAGSWVSQATHRDELIERFRNDA